jgi:hypothetical protein
LKEGFFYCDISLFCEDYHEIKMNWSVGGNALPLTFLIKVKAILLAGSRREGE